MLYRLLTAAGLLAALVPAGAAPKPKSVPDPVPFYATTVGDAWVVVNPKGVTWSWVVTDVQSKDGALVVTAAEILNGGKRGRTVTHEVSARGVTRVAEDGKPLPVPDCLIKLPPVAGAKWEQDVFTPDGTKRTGTLVKKVVGEEEVETPAGTFKAVRVDTEYPAGRPTQKSWYAPGVGEVMTDVQGTIYKLKSFSPAKR